VATHHHWHEECYVPRGILLTGFVFAVSAALEAATGGALGLGITGLSNTALLGRFMGHLAVGSVVSGVIGATMTPCAPCGQSSSNTQASANPLLSKREEQLGEYLAKTVGDHATHAAQSAAMDAVVPGAGLPTHLLTTATKAATTGWGK